MHGMAWHGVCRCQPRRPCMQPEMYGLRACMHAWGSCTKPLAVARDEEECTACIAQREEHVYLVAYAATTLKGTACPAKAATRIACAATCVRL